MLNKILALLTFAVSFCCWGESLVRLTPIAPEQHLLQVEMELKQAPVGSVTMTMPIWRTGRYQQLDFAQAMTNLEVFDGKGNKLALKALSDHQWQVENADTGPLTVRYQVTANELGMRTRHLDESHLFADFAAVVLAVEGMQWQPYIVELSVPRHWQIRSGLERGHKRNQLVAENYQQLIDSPIEVGLHELRTFSVHGADFELVVWGHTPADLDKMAADTQKLVEAAYQLWGKFPFDKYVFMVHATDNVRGGTEHLNSTIMQWDRFKFNDPENYLSFMGLVSHEFVHTWNVKAYRPAALVPYDLSERQFTSLLWLAEGSTSYLQEKLLLQAELIDEEKYYKRLAKRLGAHQASPGGHHQSPADASWYSWTQKSGQHRHNFDGNIYQEGFVATLALDLWLLEQSGNQYGVGALHRKLYEQYSLPNGLTVAQVQAAIKELAPQAEVKTWWQQHINSPLTVDWTQLLAKAGLHNNINEKTKFHVGASLKAAANGVKVKSVSLQSPAWQAGLTEGDRIIAVNGFAVSSDNFERVQKSWQPGDILELHLFRQGILTKRELTLAEPMPKIHKLTLAEQASAAENELRKAWLENR